MTDSIRNTLTRFSDEARALLMDLIAIPSTPGNEGAAQDLFFDALQKIDSRIQVNRHPIAGDVENDIDYGKPYGSSIAEHSYNTVARWTGTCSREAPSLILQSHIDVVDAGEWSEAFKPRFDGQYVWGRGACDAKGQLITLWLVLKTLLHLNLSLRGDLIVQVVVEEEIGGNGTLDLIKKGYRADAAIVLEPTECHVHPSHRGCLTFQYQLTGEAVHMGRQECGISAVDQVIELIGLLEDYKQELLNTARTHPLYASCASPVQLNIGVIHAGSWPGTLAESAVVVGDVGFPPNITIEQVKQDLQTRIAHAASPRLRDRFTLAFVGLHNDAYEISPDHPIVQTLLQASGGVRHNDPLMGLNVSCDARLHTKRANIPAVIFGPGSLTVAHSAEEHIEWNKVLQAAKVLTHTVLQWCQPSD